jgi:hypothetical protein
MGVLWDCACMFFRLYRIFKFENKMKFFFSLGEEDDLP